MNKLMLPLLALLSIVLLMPGCKSKEEERDAHMQSARTLVEQGKCDEAMLEARAAADLDPELTEAFLVMGRCDMEADKYEEAAQNFSRVLALTPDSLEALLGLSRAALVANDLSKVEEFVTKARTISPDSLDVEILQAALFMKQQKYTEAIPLLEKVLEKDPANEEAAVGLVSSYINSGEREKGVALLDSSYKTHPESTAIVSLLYTLALQDNDLQKAEEWLAPLMKLEPENENLILQQADIRFASQREAEARKGLDDFLQAHPKADTIRGRIADLEADAGKFDTALTLLEQAPENTPIIRLFKASILAQSGRMDEAIAALKNLAVDPQAGKQATDARLGLVEIYLDQQKEDLAFTELSAIIAKEPDNINARSLRGRIAFTLQRFDDAIEDLEVASAAQPDDPLINLALADAYNASGDLEMAEKNITQVIQRHPDFGQGYLTMANFYLMQNKPDAALMSLSIGKSSAPDDPSIPLTEADILTNLRRFDKAVETLEGLAKNSAYTETALLRIAAVQGTAGQHDKAVATYDRLLALNKDARGAAEGRIRALIGGGKEKAALSYAEKRQAERPEDPAAAFMVAEAAMANRNREKTEKALLATLDIAPQWEQPLTIIAQMYMAEGKIDRAIEVARKATSRVPDASGPAVVLGMLLEEKGDLDAAESTYRNIMIKDPENALTANNLAFLLTQHKPDPARLKEAEDFARIAAATGIPAAMDTFGWVQHLRGNNADAEVTLRQARQEMPDSPALSYHLAATLAAQGKSGGDSPEAKEKTDEAKALLLGIISTMGEVPYKEDARALLKSMNE